MAQASGASMAAEQLQVLSSHAAWPLLLQHLARRPRAVCALAATCRGLRAAVQQCCAGALVLRVQLDGWPLAAAALPRWLHAGGQLLRELQLWQCQLQWGKFGTSTAPLAAALQQAAEAGGGVQLRALVTAQPFHDAGSLLGAWLPARHLTRLELRLPEQLQLDKEHADRFSSSHAAALAALTGLRQLVADGAAVDALLPALPGLSRLSALQLGPVSSPEAAASLGQQLPVQLQRLELTLGPPWRPFPAPELERLSLLTSLGGRFSLQPAAVLPPRLRELRGAHGLASVAQLLPLAQLQLLELCDCDAPAEQLQQLSSVGALGQPGGELHLRLGGPCTVDAAAAAWPLLPLARLYAECTAATRAALRHLGKAAGLTSLELCDMCLQVSAPRFAADVLAGLSRLEELSLFDLRFDAGDFEPGGAAGAAGAPAFVPGGGAAVQLVSAIVRLPRLRALSLEHIFAPDGAAELTQLTAATGLTRLRITDACAASVAAVVPALRQLRLLGVTYSDLTDAAVAAIAGLSGLEVLDVSNCGALTLTDAHFDCLIAGLQRLRECESREWEDYEQGDPAFEGRNRMREHCARVAAKAVEEEGAGA